MVIDLDSDDFPTREAASQGLPRWIVEAESSLRQVLAKKPGADLRWRVETLLDALDRSPLKDERLRQSRALSALEWAGTHEARLVLEGLAKGADGAWLTREARAALARLAQRGGR